MSPILTLGGFRTGTILNAADYITTAGGTGAGMQGALDACPLGGQIYAPSEFGPWVPPSQAGWTIEQPVTIFSDGRGIAENLGFNYYNHATDGTKNSVVFTIASGVDDVYIHDAVFSVGDFGIPSATGTGDAIRFAGPIASTNIWLERLKLYYAGRSGVRFTGGGAVVTFRMSDVSVFQSRGDGIYLNTVHNITLTNCSASSCRGAGMRIVSCNNGMQLIGMDLESNGVDLAFSSNFDGQMILEGCNGGTIMGGDIEGYHTINPNAKIGIAMNACNGVVISGVTFALTDVAAATGTKGIQLINGCKCNTILGNYHAYVDVLVNMSSSTDEVGNVVFPQAAGAVSANAAGTIGVPTPASNRNFVFATNLTAGVADNKGVGIKFPAMSAEADIAAGVLNEGLQFYDTASNNFKRRDDNSTDVVP